MKATALPPGTLILALALPLAGCEIVLDINEDYRVGTLPGGGAGGTSSGGAGDGGVGGTTTSGGSGGGGGGVGGSVSCPGNMANLSTFCIDTHEVSKGDYQGFIDANPDTGSQGADCTGNTSFVPSGGWPPGAGEENLPVAYVDWCDAVAYCGWAGKRLCGAIGGGGNTNGAANDANISQWYAACTQGGVTAFPYGDAFVETTCVDDAFDGIAGFDPVTDVARNVGAASDCHGNAAPYDQIFDMSGNVREWVDNCMGTKCWTRGGSFADQQNGVQCSVKGDEFPTAALDTVGFRCCAD